MKIHIANKCFSGFSAILSLALLLTCIWILTSLFVPQSKNWDGNNCSWINRRMLCENMSSPSFEDEHGAIIIEVKKPTSRSLGMWTEFYGMTPKFRLVLILSLCGVILGSLVQFGCALILVSSPEYKIPNRSRRIVYVLFSVFIIYMVGFALPLTFKRQRKFDDEESELHTMSTLNSSIMRFMNTFRWNYILKDLYLFYLELFSNIIFIFLNMVVSCCLLRCTIYEDYDI